VLQVSTDAQVSMHSSYKSITEFIIDTVNSFAEHARTNGPGPVLLIKHHPMDRGYCDYSSLIKRLAKQHNLIGYVRYIHDQNLPRLLANALGVVTINSTVGLSAIHHGTPVIALGEAVYNMPGLTCQDDLCQFWKSPEQYKPSAQLSDSFRNYLVAHNQINGNFYIALPKSVLVPAPACKGLQASIKKVALRESDAKAPSHQV
jgi:capsular polysaccharide export protein